MKTTKDNNLGLWGPVILTVTFTFLMATPVAGFSAILTSASVAISYNGASTGDSGDSVWNTDNSGALVEATLVDRRDSDMTSKAVVRGQQETAAYAWATDRVYDKFTAGSFAEATLTIDFTVDTPGTIEYNLGNSGFLALGSGDGGIAEVAVVSYIKFKKYVSSWPTVSNSSVSGTAKIAGNKLTHEAYVAGVSGVFAGKALSNNGMDVGFSQFMSVLLEDVGDYALTLQLSTSARSGTFTGGGTDITATSDSFNSFGFGGEFWNVVGGTASFHDSNNPSNNYAPGQQGSVPEPAMLVLLGAGFAGYLPIGRRV